MRWARGGRPPVMGLPRAAAAPTATVLSYRPVRAVRPSVPVITRSEDQHGPLLRNLRQGVDGWLQSPVVGDEPCPRPPSLPAESPAAHHHAEGRPDEGARLHPLPPNHDEERQVAFGAALPRHRTRQDRLPTRRPVSSCPVSRVFVEFIRPSCAAMLAGFPAKNIPLGAF